MRNPFVSRKALTARQEVLEIVRAAQFASQPLGGTNVDTRQISNAFVKVTSGSYAFMYASQPAVRSVVDYISRNVAQLQLCLYERVSDDDRRKADDEPAAEVIRSPNAFTPGQQFIYDLVAEFLIYDDAYALKMRDPGSGELRLIHVPTFAVGILGALRFVPEGYRLYRADGTFFDVPPGDMIHWRGYNPEDPRCGYSKLETLRQELAADAAARAAKTELDKSGLMPKGWLERPLDAPQWSEEARTRFREESANALKGATRTLPVWEEGMVFKQASVSPEDAQLLQSRQFTQSQVNAAYGLQNLPPQSEDERIQVYADVLTPLCEMLCDFLELQLLRDEFGKDDYYFEFDIDEKLRGQSVARWAAITSTIGVPWRTVNEGRALEGLPPVENGDDLYVPLNVAVAGEQGSPQNPQLPAPNVMPIQSPNGKPQDGSYREQPKALMNGDRVVQLVDERRKDQQRQDKYADEMTRLLKRHFARQHTGLQEKATSRVGSDWTRRLGLLLEDALTGIVEREAARYMLKFAAPDPFDMGMVVNWLRATALGIAKAVNEVTQADIHKLGMDEAFTRARNVRAPAAGASAAGTATGFARVEAAKQAPMAELRQKTWVADTDRHAEFDGETVPLDGHFSAGFEPGTAPNCRCTVAVT